MNKKSITLIFIGFMFLFFVILKLLPIITGNPFLSCKYKIPSPATFIIGESSGGALCYARVATKEKNIKICDKLNKQPYYKNVCVEEIARQQKNPTFCNNVVMAPPYDESMSKEAFLNYCLNYISTYNSDSALCEKMPNNDSKDSCYWNVAIMARDVSFCAKINKIESKNKCIKN